MSCEDETAEILRRAGHKMTPQRLMIVRALRHSERHMSAGQILDQVREVYPFVDISTVYRTLDVLKRLRLATSTDMGGGDVVFEWAPAEPHHHLICTACGGVLEIGHCYLDDLATRIAGDFGFVPDLHHFAIFGLCAQCRAIEGTDADAP